MSAAAAPVKPRKKAPAPPAADLTIHNYYKAVDHAPEYSNPCRFAPQHPFRALICARAGAGKTLLTLNLIRICDCFDVVYLFARTLDEPLYKLLVKIGTPAEDEDAEEHIEAEDEDAPKHPLVLASNTLDDLPDVDELNDDDQKLFIFDDMVTASVKENKLITDYFIRARKKNVSCMYLTQSYFSVNKDIRLQCNYVFLKGINSTRTLAQIIQDFSIDIDPKKLEEMYKQATKEGEFFMLDMVTKDGALRYRQGLGKSLAIAE